MKSTLSGKETLLGIAGVIVSVQMLGEASPIASKAVDQAKMSVVDVMEAGFEAVPNPLDAPLEALNDLTTASHHQLGLAAAVMMDDLEGDPDVPASEPILAPDDLQVAAAVMLDHMSNDAATQVVAPDDNLMEDGMVAEAAEALDAVEDEAIAELAAVLDPIEDVVDVASVKQALGEQKASVSGLFSGLGSKRDSVLGTKDQASHAIGSIGSAGDIKNKVDSPLGGRGGAAAKIKKIAAAFPTLGGSHASTSLAGIDAGQGEAADIIRSIVKRKKGQLHHCYQKLLITEPDLRGQLGVQVNIVEGRVVSLHTSTNQSGNQALDSCVKRKIRGWRFPAKVTDDIRLLFNFQH